jgi:high affinity choline transporter 7
MHFRLAGGEQLIGLPPLIKYPLFDEESGTQLFPFRTMSMILSMISLLGISQITWYVISGIIELRNYKKNWGVEDSWIF